MECHGGCNKRHLNDTTRDLKRNCQLVSESVENSMFLNIQNYLINYIAKGIIVKL